MKQRVYGLLESGISRAAQHVRVSLLTLILANVAAVVLESVPDLALEYSWLWLSFERLSIAVFSLEYVARVWTCTQNPRYAHPFWGRLRYVISPLPLIDVLAILPGYLPLLFTVDLRILRLLRLFRLLRILKLSRYTQAMDHIGHAVRSKREELSIVLVACGIALLLSSTALYWIEHDEQPEVFSSIPQALWWGVSTLTTVGYGDIYPITPLGKLFAAIFAIAGVGLFTLPAAIMASAFVAGLPAHQRSKKCPHCGADL
jgi:voltage-gated potassium channel